MSAITSNVSGLPAAPGPTAAMQGCPAMPTTVSGGGGGASDDITSITQKLESLVSQLSGLVAALAGQQALSAPAPATPAPPAIAPATPVAAPAAAPAASPAVAPSPLAGFTMSADAASAASITTALGSIDRTSVGSALLASVRNRGVQLEVLSDADFNARSNNRLDAAAVFMGGAGTTPTVLIRQGQLVAPDPARLEHILAHELTHAAQWANGEFETSYAALAGLPANALTADQGTVGNTLMKESGAELVAGLIAAQQTNPSITASIAKNLPGAEQADWKIVNEGGYNPKGYVLPQVVSPTAVALVKRGAGIA
ncbi:MAG: hypothetical protein JWN41_865 [Thermoleophilia bacterium]|nr:hypothetical protein [Thermoleophilia bacterium]